MFPSSATITASRLLRALRSGLDAPQQFIAPACAGAAYPSGVADTCDISRLALQHHQHQHMQLWALCCGRLLHSQAPRQHGQRHWYERGTAGPLIRPPQAPSATLQRRSWFSWASRTRRTSRSQPERQQQQGPPVYPRHPQRYRLHGFEWIDDYRCGMRQVPLVAKLCTSAGACREAMAKCSGAGHSMMPVKVDSSNF